jgi:hypothetical protein
MKESILEQLEFERQKRELIKAAEQQKKIPKVPKKEPVAYQDERQETIEEIFSKAYPVSKSEVTRDRVEEDDKKFAWEYELEKYRQDRLKNRFCIIGGICGILSLVMNIWFHISEIKGFFL